MKVTLDKLRELVPSTKDALAQVILDIINDTFGSDFTINEILSQLSTPKPEHGDVCLACFSFLRKLKPLNDSIKVKLGVDVNPNMIANTISKELLQRAQNGSISAMDGKFIHKVTVTGAYVNIALSMSFHGQVLTSILSGEFQADKNDVKKDKVMIEYSQPNTHKAFHVGHMRNVALGDSLTRLYRKNGHEVVPVNYFGDEGAHVAKCLWYLQKVYLPKAQEALEKGLAFDPSDKTSVYPLKSIEDIDSIPSSERAEWLGGLYTAAVDLLSLSNYTDLAFPQVIAAKVLTKDDHPDPEAPANWHLCTLDIGADKPVNVVCGGTDYNINDIVAYLPVGAKLTKKMGVVEPKDMKGVSSCGIMLAARELGIETDEPKTEDVPAPKKGKKGVSANSAATANNKIYTLPSTSTPGQCLAEIGRKPEFTGESVMEEFKRLNKEAADVLLALEHNDPEQVALWRKTGQWSLDEFHAIYKWVDASFEHDFTESECSEPSREIVDKWLNQGILSHMDGAVVADLTQFNLGKCILLKSDGAGLYATKDLALAARKFDQFKVDKSIYIVDSAQTFHFQQVFKTLEIAGYEQAKKCLHIPYGIVVLPSGRMSSRKGNVLLFSQLKSTLMNVLTEKYSRGEVVSEENARKIAVASIKYGMLNHDTMKDIVFDLEKWTNNTGNTGPYILYAYSRIMSIFTVRDNYDGLKFDIVNSLTKLGVTREVINKYTSEERLDFGAFITSEDGKIVADKINYDQYLDIDIERAIALQFHKFWPTIQTAVDSNNPSGVCDYVFNLAQSFSTWYEQVRLTALTIEAVPTKLALIFCIAEMLKATMQTLGVTVVKQM